MESQSWLKRYQSPPTITPQQASNAFDLLWLQALRRAKAQLAQLQQSHSQHKSE